MNEDTRKKLACLFESFLKINYTISGSAAAQMLARSLFNKDHIDLAKELDIHDKYFEER